MASPYNHGLLTGSILPLIYNTPELNDIRLTAHRFYVDNYEKWFKHFGISRDEMLILMPDISRVDILSGTTTSEYLAPPKSKNIEY